jgi:hypothetical protein
MLLEFLGVLRNIGKFLKKFGEFKACFIAVSKKGEVSRASSLEATVGGERGGATPKLEFPCSIPFLCYPNKGQLTFSLQIIPKRFQNKKISFGIFGDLAYRLVFTISTTVAFQPNQDDDMDVSLSVTGDASMTIQAPVGNIGAKGTLSGTVTFKNCKFEKKGCDGDTELTLKGIFEASISGAGLSQTFKVSCSATENFATIISARFSWADADINCTANGLGEAFESVVDGAGQIIDSAGNLIEDMWEYGTDKVDSLVTYWMSSSL